VPEKDSHGAFGSSVGQDYDSCHRFDVYNASGTCESWNFDIHAVSTCEHYVYEEDDMEVIRIRRVKYDKKIQYLIYFISIIIYFLKLFKESLYFFLTLLLNY